MKLLITKNLYKQTNADLWVSDDCKTVRAHSYGWWRFVETDKVGNVVFNAYRYSVSTGGHQGDVETILDRLGIRAALYLTRTARSLDGNRDCVKTGGIQDAITDEIACIRQEQADMREAMAVKGSRKAKNAERAKEITALDYRVKDLERWRDEYIDLQPLPAVAGKVWLSQRQRGYEAFFRKPNGVLDTNGHKAFMATLLHHREAPPSLAGLKQLLGVKTGSEQVETLLRYEFTADLNNQVPDLDTPEYEELKAWLTTRGITAATLTTLSLDKMHSYLTNRTNRKTYEPREPEAFPVAEHVRALANIEGVELLDTDRKLRAEGRRQSHCIGGSAYINRCRKGYHALNYKGYTFFLDTGGAILETRGKHNSGTPISVQDELMSMLFPRTFARRA